LNAKPWYELPVNILSEEGQVMPVKPKPSEEPPIKTSGETGHEINDVNANPSDKPPEKITTEEGHEIALETKPSYDPPEKIPIHATPEHAKPSEEPPEKMVAEQFTWLTAKPSFDPPKNTLVETGQEIIFKTKPW